MYYNVAGIVYSDELYHHGIKGQKWGLRRYQNADGTLTPAGRERYGTESLGKYSNDHSLLRRMATGDTLLGVHRAQNKAELKYEQSAKKAQMKGKTKKAKNLKTMGEAIKNTNIDRDKYLAKTSTGKLIAQNLLMGRYGADNYRIARQRGSSKGKAAVSALMSQWSGVHMEAYAEYGRLHNKKK